MLKDIRDSRRISTYVAESIALTEQSATQYASAEEHSSQASEHEEGESMEVELSKESSSSTASVDLFPVQAFILSSEYWPEFHREQFKLPEALIHPFDNFTKYVHLFYFATEFKLPSILTKTFKKSAGPTCK